MPCYDYKCQVCGESFEILQTSWTADAPKHCGMPAERQIGRTTPIFKGGGWAADLYSSSPKNGSSDDNS